VFAAKIVCDPAADGGFHWQAVGNGTATQTNALDTSGPSTFGACAASVPAEDACALNKAPAQDAEDPRVAAGTLTPGAPTVPWVVWAEDTGGGRHAIFSSRLVGGTHFELFNGGNPLSNPANDATHPDITFFRNVPYVSWVATVGSAKLGFAGHFEGAAFVLDTPGGIRLTPGTPPVGLIDFRVPVSSSCTADPFTADGSTCPGGTPDAPFALFTRAGAPQALFAQAAGPCVVILGQVVRTRRPVGRVPFGERAKGRLRVRRNLRVNGRPLRPGRYLITLRAFSGKGPRRVVAHAQPVVMRIRR
jgi:hypothetical protein